MKLQRVVIDGYRSFAQRTEVHLDHSVTIIVGANDHGKSNLLAALTHLNSDTPFDAETDLNWDREDAADNLPSIEFELALSQSEQDDLLDEEREFRERLTTAAQALAEATEAMNAATTAHTAATAAVSEAAQAVEPAKATGVAETIQAAEAQHVAAQARATETSQALEAAERNYAAQAALAATAEKEAGDTEQLPQSKAAATLTVCRTGLRGLLQPTETPAGYHPRVVADFLSRHLPRVELIQPQPRLTDSVTAADLAEEQHDFMRGIFYYAGLDARDCAELFVQTDRTQRRLTDASAALNKTLSESWSQGKDLEFILAHRTDEIDLRIKDPSVQTTYVRASRRSSGFAHFFTLKTTLHAREREHPAESYLYLFDEPGIYLHPAGQHDLLRVLERLAAENQVVYSTHSVFMINRTFPVRHRLVLKGPQGTIVDPKPFTGRWGITIDALGISAAGTVLFADHVLLCEGDSEAILIPAIFQALARVGKTRLDLNSLAVIGTGASRNADALIRILIESPASPKVAVLVDGDEGGKERLKQAKEITESRGIKAKALPDGETVEDCLPLADDLYVQAVARYAARLVSGGIAAEVVDPLIATARASHGQWSKNHKVGLGAWGEETCRNLAKLDKPPSKIGIAREYVQLLDDVDTKSLLRKHQRAEKLAAMIQELLALPELDNVATEVFAS